MENGRRGGVAAVFEQVRHRVRSRWIAGAAGAAGVLAVAASDSRHDVLPVLSALGLLVAGAAFASRWRITGNGATGRIGLGLLVAGLHLPVGSIVTDLLGAASSDVGTAAEVGTLLTAALLCLGGPRPERRPAAVLAAALLTAGCAVSAVLAGPSGSLVLLLAHLGAALGWAALAATSWRRERSLAGTTSAGPLAWVAVLVTAGLLLDCVPPLSTAAAPAATLAGDLALLAAGVVAAGYAVRRIAAALDGQERYVAGLLEQLAAHERQLQQVRGCLHDARSAVAGIRASASAASHPLMRDDPANRAALEQTVTAELQRLERLLRLPERTPSASSVHVDDLLRPVVVTHRERGLRVHWAPVGGAPVLLDGDALVVIVGNLVGNVLVHAPGAQCSVSAEVGSELVVTVADDGPGLSPGVRATAFEAGGCRAGSPGEGLGLAISRDLARRHGGDLVLDDSGAGATFRLRLPIGTPAAPVTAVGPVAAPARRVGAPPVPGPRSSPTAEQVPVRSVV